MNQRKASLGKKEEMKGRCTFFFSSQHLFVGRFGCFWGVQRVAELEERETAMTSPLLTFSFISRPGWSPNLLDCTVGLREWAGMSLVVALFGQANWVIEKARKSWGVRKGENQPAYLSGLIMRLGSLAGHRSRSNESCARCCFTCWGFQRNTVGYEPNEGDTRYAPA